MTEQKIAINDLFNDVDQALKHIIGAEKDGMLLRSASENYIEIVNDNYWRLLLVEFGYRTFHDESRRAIASAKCWHIRNPLETGSRFDRVINTYLLSVDKLVKIGKSVNDDKWEKIRYLFSLGGYAHQVDVLMEKVVLGKDPAENQNNLNLFGLPPELGDDPWSTDLSYPLIPDKYGEQSSLKEKTLDDLPEQQKKIFSVSVTQEKCFDKVSEIYFQQYGILEKLKSSISQWVPLKEAIRAYDLFIKSRPDPEVVWLHISETLPEQARGFMDKYRQIYLEAGKRGGVIGDQNIGRMMILRDILVEWGYKEELSTLKLAIQAQFLGWTGGLSDYPQHHGYFGL